MYLPKKLYESLPIIYILLGIMGIIAPERYGMFCGIVLIVIVFAILRMRYNYRMDKWLKFWRGQ